MKRRLLMLFCAIILLMQFTGCFYNLEEDWGFIDRSRNATRSDIIVKFTLIPSIFGHDTYYMSLQAQEEIENLSLEIDFCGSSGSILKTDDLYVGKVVPGNKYEFTLNQSGMQLGDLDTVKHFIVRVVGGTIKYD